MTITITRPVPKQVRFDTIKIGNAFLWGDMQSLYVKTNEEGKAMLLSGLKGSTYHFMADNMVTPIVAHIQLEYPK